MMAIECALEAGDLQLAHDLLKLEWNRIDDPATFYYRVIRDGSVATFQHLESAGMCPEWDSFRYCSNAFLELDVKNVTISEEMELLVMYKLSSYGLKNLCGDSVIVKAKNQWLVSIDLVMRWVQELRSRPRWYDFLDVDDEVMLRIRMIHNHLFFVKDEPALRGLPLKEMIFCLAIFARIHDEIPGHEVYRVMINKRNMMQFLLEIVSRLKGVKNASKEMRPRRSSVLKKLRKTYRRMKQIYSVFKIIACVQIYREIGEEDYRRCNASITVAAIKRFNQICGEAIKNTADTPNMSEKLNKLLPDVLTDSIMLNSKYRNFSSHGIPLSHLFIRDYDQIYYYHRLSDYIYIIAVSFYAVCLYLLHDCTRQMYGIMRRCRSIDDLRALIRYAGGKTIQLLQDSMFQEIEKYLSTMENYLNETNPDDLPAKQKEEFEDLLENHSCKVKIIEKLRDSHRNNLMDTAEVIAFTNTSVLSMHRLLDSKLTDITSGSYFDTMFTDWEILTTQSFDSMEFNAVVMQSYIHQYLELDHDSTEQWRYLERTKLILNHFTSDVDLDASTRATLEQNLHNALSKARNGYYQNIFALDSKAQTITQILKASLIGPKTSKDFKSRNNQFKSKLHTLRQQDEQELNLAFKKLIFNLQDIFKRTECESIEKLIRNHENITLKQRLAVQYWQLQAMEMLYSSGYFGDNFSLLTRSVPMIWGKSYRNYLAHDSLSYDLLTASGMLKILINAFVLAFDFNNFSIFSSSPKYTLDGLAILERDSFCWFGLQADLLECMKRCDIPSIEACIAQRAEISCRYLMPLGHLLRPKYYALPGIISHEQFNSENIEAVVPLLRSHFPKIKEILTISKINYAVQLNLLQFDRALHIEEAIRQFELFQPKLVTPCIGAAIPQLVAEDNFDLLVTLVDRYVGNHLKPILLMTIGRTEVERDFLQTNFDLHLSVISELTEHDLTDLFTEDYPATKYELNIAMMRNDLRLFTHIVQNCYQTSSSMLESYDLQEAMEICCCHGRLEMAQCLLENGLQCELFTMSGFLTLAIARRRWKVVDLLLKNGAYEWLDDGVNVLSIIKEGNFRLLRQILREAVPDHLKEKFVDWVVRLGSKRLLKYLDHIGVNIWEENGILTSAALNKDSNVLKFVESRLLQSTEQPSSYTELRFWTTMLQDLKILLEISIDSEFLPSIMSRNDIAQRWIELLDGILKIKDNHFAEVFHFEDPSELFCFGLPKNCFNVFEEQFHQTIRKCELYTHLIRTLPQHLSILKTTAFIEFCSPYEQIYATIELTLYSSTELHVIQNDVAMIVIQNSCHTADSISMGLRSYLLKFRHLQAASAKITTTNDENSEHFFFLLIGSISCIVQQSPRSKFNLSYLLNRPNQTSILHYIPPTASPRTVETLLRLGANPSLPDDKLRTPFRTALAQPFPLELIRLKYQYCDNPNFFGTHVFNLRDLDGFTPLHAAVGTNNYEVVQFLLDNGADPAQADQTGEAAVLCYAILNRNVRVVELLLRHSPRLVREFIDVKKRKTALESAVKINHDHIVRLLLESGSELNHRDRERCTVMKYAIELEAVEALQVILEFALRNRLIVNDDVDGLGSTALQFAVETGACEEIVQLLVCYSMQQRVADLEDLRNKYDL